MPNQKIILWLEFILGVLPITLFSLPFLLLIPFAILVPLYGIAIVVGIIGVIGLWIAFFRLVRSRGLSPRIRLLLRLGVISAVLTLGLFYFMSFGPGKTEKHAASFYYLAAPVVAAAIVAIHWLIVSSKQIPNPSFKGTPNGAP